MVANNIPILSQGIDVVNSALLNIRGVISMIDTKVSTIYGDMPDIKHHLEAIKGDLEALKIS